MLDDASMTLVQFLNYFPVLLVPGALVFFALVIRRVNNRRAALLFSLSLPGALYWCVLLPLVARMHMSSFIVSGMVLFLVLFPSAVVLPITAIIQFARLGQVTQRIGIVGEAAAAGIVALHLWTAMVAKGW